MMDLVEGRRLLPVVPHGFRENRYRVFQKNNSVIFLVFLLGTPCLLPSKCAPSTVVHASMNLLLRLQSSFLNNRFIQNQSISHSILFLSLFFSFFLVDGAQDAQSVGCVMDNAITLDCDDLGLTSIPTGILESVVTV